MANSTLPSLILLEDAIDLCDFLEATKRTIPRSKWAVESIAAAQKSEPRGDVLSHGKPRADHPGPIRSRGAVAGLRAIEQGGHAADGLGHAADAASARFRKAHESVKSALQQFPDLSQTLRQASGQGLRPATGVRVQTRRRAQW